MYQLLRGLASLYREGVVRLRNQHVHPVGAYSGKTRSMSVFLLDPNREIVVNVSRYCF